jgi:sporulation protein YlmC with PRC-barrel domain
MSGGDDGMTCGLSAASIALSWVGRSVLDHRGRKIGTVQRVHVNNRTGRPEWITVRTGRWVTTRHIAPLAGSTLGHQGLLLPYDRAAVHRAPQIMDADQMNVHEQFALYSHYLRSVAASSH